MKMGEQVVLQVLRLPPVLTMDKLLTQITNGDVTVLENISALLLICALYL